MELIDINHTVHSTTVFSKLSFRFERGQIVGLVGMNGSGKTTLLKILAGLCKPLCGNVYIEGRDLYQDRSLQSKIAYIPSTPHLYSFLSIDENLHWLCTLHGISAQKKMQILYDFDLYTERHRLFGKLSDGFKKRVCVASAWLREPTYLLLDEPCQSLDPMQRDSLWHQLTQYRQASRLIFIISHHPEELARFCDNIYLLSQGELLPYFPSPTLNEQLWSSITTVAYHSEGTTS